VGRATALRRRKSVRELRTIDSQVLSIDRLRALPKILLHDHLDGGLRPQTVLDLASEQGYGGLPTSDFDELAEWFFQGRSASLERYLEAFAHTVGVMQTAEAIERVAFEAVEDLAAHGVVYAETRMAPSLCTGTGLDRTTAIAAMLSGLQSGEAAFGLPVRLIVDAMRQDTDSVEVARDAVAFVGQGVVGFDLAGPEDGYPPSAHSGALALAAAGGLHLTIHAGEGDGVASIASALSEGAERIGHGARLIEDTTLVDGEIEALGDVATQVYDTGMALEICPTSNLHTGMYGDAGSHPVGALHRAGFAVTINTDNRLMSGITPTDEFALVVEHHDFVEQDLEIVTRRALDAAFCDDETRAIAEAKVSAGYTDAG
jgi:adenosine deaminase